VNPLTETQLPESGEPSDPLHGKVMRGRVVTKGRRVPNLARSGSGKMELPLASTGTPDASRLGFDEAEPPEGFASKRWGSSSD
jgi:hypothetical protein